MGSQGLFLSKPSCLWARAGYTLDKLSPHRRALTDGRGRHARCQPHINLGFSILHKDTSTCSSALPTVGIWTSDLPTTNWPALYPLSYSRQHDSVAEAALKLVQILFKGVRGIVFLCQQFCRHPVLHHLLQGDKLRAVTSLFPIYMYPQATGQRLVVCPWLLKQIWLPLQVADQHTCTCISTEGKICVNLKFLL